MFEKLKALGYEIAALHHAEAILKHDLLEESEQLEELLLNLKIPVELLIYGGGGENELTQQIRKQLSEKYGWKKHRFEIKKLIDGEEKESISHEIDHVKKTERGTIALEIEWNNKDPFFDRDLENFKRLHADGVISIGSIITRGSSLHGALKEIVEKFAHDHRIDSVSKLSNYYNPTPRQLLIGENWMTG